MVSVCCFATWTRGFTLSPTYPTTTTRVFLSIADTFVRCTWLLRLPRDLTRTLTRWLFLFSFLFYFLLCFLFCFLCFLYCFFNCFSGSFSGLFQHSTPLLTVWVNGIDGIIARIHIHIRVAGGSVYRVALQPAGGAGVVLASAHMVQPCLRHPLVPIRPVPSEQIARQVQTLARIACPYQPAPLIITIQISYLPILCHQRTRVPQRIRARGEKRR